MRGLSHAIILMINQPSPKGFGDAVLRAASFMTTDKFFIHAGVDILYPNHKINLLMMLDHVNKHSVDSVLLYDLVDNPKMYGVIVGNESVTSSLLRIFLRNQKVPPSNNAVVAVYLFNELLFDALKRTRPRVGEHQLTDAIPFALLIRFI